MSNNVYVLEIDERGHFAASNLSSDRYVVRIPTGTFGHDEEAYEQNWACPPLLVDARAGPVRNLVVVVQRPVPVVLWPGAGERAGMGFRILTADRLPCMYGAFQGSAPEQVRLAPGNYVVALSRMGERFRESPFIVGSSKVTLDLSQR
jgi:hypothetical protein